ncbi:hypothetical protein ACFV5G_23340 [Streptomyces sp. NPDC059766]|uniref:hypothetical protein n=1 Tax=Streptomyces sp. NPDC059766 TaxID=3346940 RepID=UPI00364A230F
MSCWIGRITTFAAVAVPVVIAHAAPGLARRLAPRRSLLRLLRTLAFESGSVRSSGAVMVRLEGW